MRLLFTYTRSTKQRGKQAHPRLFSPILRSPPLLLSLPFLQTRGFHNRRLSSWIRQAIMQANRYGSIGQIHQLGTERNLRRQFDSDSCARHRDNVLLDFETGSLIPTRTFEQSNLFHSRFNSFVTASVRKYKILNKGIFWAVLSYIDNYYFVLLFLELTVLVCSQMIFTNILRCVGLFNNFFVINC